MVVFTTLMTLYANSATQKLNSAAFGYASVLISLCNAWPNSWKAFSTVQRRR